MANKIDAIVSGPEYFQGANKKIGFILNPAAQNGRALKVFKSVFPNILSQLGHKGDKTYNTESLYKNDFNDPNDGFITLLTTKRGDAMQFGESLIIEHNCDVIVPIGGDGTINEAVNGYMKAKGGEKGVRFAVLPIGTGGDFKRSLGLSNEKEALTAISEGIYIKCDVGTVDCTDIEDANKVNSRYFINECGIGMSGTVCDNINKGSKMFGALSFYYNTVKSGLSFSMFPARYRADGGEWMPFNLYLVEVANGKFCGGAMKLAPYAELYDKIFHVTVLHDVSFLEFLKYTPDIYKGIVETNPHCTIVPCKEITIEAIPVENKEQQENNGMIETEGEVVGRLPCTCKIIPSAVNLIIPKGLYPLK